MFEHSRETGVVTPLFERLVDEDPRELGEYRAAGVFSKEALRESVRVELNRLLNTRSYNTLDENPRSGRSVIDYGMPDFSHFYPPSVDNQRRLAYEITQCLAAFEPRLRRVRVHVERVNDAYRTLSVRIDAMLVIDATGEPVSFPFFIKSKQGVVEVHGCT